MKRKFAATIWRNRIGHLVPRVILAAVVIAFAWLLLTAPVLAAKPKVKWTPVEPEYIRTSNGTIISAGKDSGGFWVIVDPLLFFKHDELTRKRQVEYTFQNVVPESLKAKSQLRVFQEKGDGEFGPRIATYSRQLGLKMHVKQEVVKKPPQPKKPFEASRFGGI